MMGKHGERMQFESRVGAGVGEEEFAEEDA